ncbi:regulatory protein SpoVG [Thermotomaculum hydrothermale]|uniref:Regulatory protein SpoVG n=1 Tax=Thermotomaculum hydrothermale TaxID=981385 RepID=A0A7R6PTA7_9BACT|nr:SpoVG family protein [Thermotomaculum hydrothermale]BBB32247.1 regulatory protein SpoVG [Thermotomaculum hydrothermale]
MQVTEVKITPVNNVSKLKGFASVVFDNCFIVTDIKIIQTPNGAFLSMPSKKSRNGKFRDVAHPLNMDTRLMIENKVFEEFEKVTGEKLERRKAVDSTEEQKATEEVEQAEEKVDTSDLLTAKEFGY